MKRNALTETVGWTRLGQGTLLFVLHQYIGTWGIPILAVYLIAYVGDLLRLLGKPVPAKIGYFILTGTPYYPIQIALGLFLGWMIGRRVQHRTMLWVWILPFAYLMFAVATIRTLVPNWIPPMYQAGVGESRWKHYFGWGCGAHPCFDQTAITLLFYAAASYSIGAWLARRMAKRRHLIGRRESWAFVITGLIFVFISVYELALVIQVGWKTMYLGIVATPLGIGAFLILYAVLLRRRLVAGGMANEAPAEHTAA